MQGIRIHGGHIIRQQSPSLKLGGRFLSSQSFVSAQSTTCSYRSSVTPYYRVLHHSWSNPHLLRTPPHHGAVSLIIASTRGHPGEPIGKRRCQHKNPTVRHVYFSLSLWFFRCSFSSYLYPMHGVWCYHWSFVLELCRVVLCLEAFITWCV